MKIRLQTKDKNALAVCTGLRYISFLFIWTTIREEKACLRQKVNGYLVLYAHMKYLQYKVCCSCFASNADIKAGCR